MIFQINTMKTNLLNRNCRAVLQKAQPLVVSPAATRCSRRVAFRRVAFHQSNVRRCWRVMAFAGFAATAMPPMAQARSSLVVQRRADALVDEAAHRYLEGKFSRALLLCVQATQIAPDYPRAWVGLGKTQAALGERDQAGRAFRQALRVGARGADAERAKNGLRSLGLSIREIKAAPLTVPTRSIAPLKSWKARRTFVVSPDGEWKSIAEAIKAAPPYSRIEIAPGTYRESLLVDKPLQIIGSKLGDVTIESTDAPCLSLRADGAIISRLVFKANVSALGNNRFHAVEIPFGRSLLSDCEVRTESRAGISAYGPKTHPLILRCKVSGARTSGIIVYGRARADIDRCDISNSAYAGLEVFEAGNAFMRGCTIHQNRTGVIAETTATVVMQDCTVENNVWQGVRVEPYGNLFLRRTGVQGNTHNVSLGKAGRFVAVR